MKNRSNGWMILLCIATLLSLACSSPTAPQEPDPNGELVPGPCYTTPEGRIICIDSWE